MSDVLKVKNINITIYRSISKNISHIAIYKNIKICFVELLYKDMYCRATLYIFLYFNVRIQFYFSVPDLFSFY